MSKNTGLGETMSSRPSRAARRRETAALPTVAPVEAESPEQEAPAPAPAYDPPAAQPLSGQREGAIPPAPAYVPPAAQPQGLGRLQARVKPSKVRITTDVEEDVHTRLEYVKDTLKFNVTDIVSEALDRLFDGMNVPSAKEISAKKRR